MYRIFFILLCVFSTLVKAETLSLPPPPVDHAFQFSMNLTDKNMLQAQWKMLPGFHLYRDRFAFRVVDAAHATLGTPIWPPGIPKEDQILGKYEVYDNELIIPIPITKLAQNTFTLETTYQGCADSGFCYPPVIKQVVIDVTNATTNLSATTAAPHDAAIISEQDRISKILASKNLGLILLGFCLFGLLLSFTPCVLPMIPILSGIILGQRHRLSTAQAFKLSLTYVLSMAFTYAIAGLFAGLIGSYLQSIFQIPWVIILFSLLFVLLALSLFGFYELKLPQQWQQSINHLSHRQKAGNYIGVAIMGCLATLIVSPCVSPPLIGALSYVSKTGDALLGGLALWSMGIGMGIPLLIIGTTEGRYLPRSGKWMNVIKAFFGVVLLGVAIQLLERILPNALTQLLWSILCICLAVYLGAFDRTPDQPWLKFIKGLGLVLAVYGIILMIGTAMGNNDLTQPLKNLAVTKAVNVSATSELHFQKISTLSELDKAINQAKSQQQGVMLDFYADWCLACKQMERNTFADAAVQAALKNRVLLQVDMTANTPEIQAITKKLNVIAPPTLLFFDKNGQELASQRIIGEVPAAEFIRRVPLN